MSQIIMLKIFTFTHQICIFCPVLRCFDHQGPYNHIHHLSELRNLFLSHRFLTYNPAERITAEEALNHEYFSENPLPIKPAMFPTWPAKSELGYRKAIASPKPPSGGRDYKQLVRSMFKKRFDSLNCLPLCEYVLE